MNEPYLKQSFAASLFADADAKYATMKAALTSADFQGKTEAEVQRWLAEEQKELMRRLFQAHITLRGQAQVQEPVVGADGQTRTHVRHETSRKLCPSGKRA